MKLKPMLIVAATIVAVAGAFAARAQTPDAPAAQASVAPGIQAPKLMNMLRNAKLSEVANGAPANWDAYEGGFVLAPGQGYKGSDAVTMTRAGDDKARGVSQMVTLDQNAPAPIVIAGWSRAQNVSGEADNGYAVYADLTYADGTNGWGFFAPFQTGTRDWNRAQLEIKPEKAVKSLVFYALFRGHTGQVWFSDLEVNVANAAVAKVAVAPVDSVEKLAPVEAQKNSEKRPFVAQLPPADAMKVVPLQQENLLANPDWEQVAGGVPASWIKWNEGFELRPNAGRAGKTAAFIERAATDGERGIGQKLDLDQKVAQPVTIAGWSRAEDVNGTPDADYSLYADVTFQNGSNLWGSSASFGTGTHDWQKVSFNITPETPVKSLTVYALFRNHTGRVWFSDLSVGSARPPAGAVLFDGLAVQPQLPAREVALRAAPTFRTQDGLEMGLENGRVTALRLDGREVKSSASGGFLVRDVANASGYYALGEGANSDLKLQLQTKVSAAPDHLTIEGSVADLSGRDRAISLVFALPVDARNWTWDQTMRENSRVGEGELSNLVGFFAGSNGSASLYPLANIRDPRSGLAIAVDPDFAAQNRLAVNGATRQFYLAYDFGLAPQKSAANFRFVIYRTDPKWGFRDALNRWNTLFPQTHEARGAAKQQGLWMPFTDVRQVEGWRDFGFRFREAIVASATDEDAAKWDAANGIATFRYFEPMTWWMAMAPGVPRTYEAAIAQLQRTAADPQSPQYAQARAVLSSGFREDSGRYAVSFRDEPWSSGAVWSLNPDPNLPGDSTGASLGWNSQKRATYRSGELAGEYLDSLEGYVTSNLNFDRTQWKVARAPLTFDTATSQPAQHKALLAYDYARWESGQLHQMDKLLFANSVPARFSFLAPWLDVMGTEADWMPGGIWTPDSDAQMSLRRAMSGAKPYLLLQNADFSKFTSEYVEKYMQRSLFYGMLPGFFSADASSDPYWLDPKLYNRDRPLFKKYLPLIQTVAQAGWQPVTLATCDNPDLWLERFGASGGPLYLTLRNNAATPQRARLALDASLQITGAPKDLVSGRAATTAPGTLEIEVGAGETAVLKLG